MKGNGKLELADSVTLLRDQPNAIPSGSPGARRAAEKVATPATTLLVVDDNAAVRGLEAEMLCREGYRVLQAASAEEALRLAREVKVIHLLITDFATAQVDGLELSHRFLKVHPRTPVLIVSGSLPLLRDGARDLERVALLAKPFAWNELLRLVRALLDASVPSTIRMPCRCD